jgi:WD40 repeat protein/serine/threonine protein kinase
LLAAHEGAGEFLGDPPLTAKIEEELARHKPEEAGERIGPYKLMEEIGEGGFGTVWVAEQEKPVRRRVALKIIKMGMDTKEVIARFEQERQALAMMDHANIAKVLDAGATQFGRPFFVMELVRGVKITDYCDDKQLSTRERIELFITVCHAVQHAHQKGIIHRDLKPSNILVTINDGKAVPKVIDFGVAKATQGRLVEQTVYTQFQQMIGTPLYMSPEQAELTSLDIDTRSDIYSLGVLLYELLTGHTPIEQGTLARVGIDEIRRLIREVDPPRPSLRMRTLDGAEITTAAKRRKTEPAKLFGALQGDLDWIVMKCIEKDRSRRYDTANGLAMDLQRHLRNEVVIARPPTTAYLLSRFIRRNQGVFIAGTAVAASLVLGIAASLWQAMRATHAEREQRTLRTAAEAARVGEATQRQAADAARAEESKQRKLAQLQAYAADMKAAQAALQQSSRQQAVNLLNQYWPQPGEPDLRGIEWRYLSRAAKGDEIYTWKHPGMVSGAQFSPDGRNVATACFDGVLRIWNVASGKLVTQFERGVSDEAIHLSFCYAPDGSTLASAARDGIAVLDSATLRVKQTLEFLQADKANPNDISLVYAPDGRWLAAAFGRSIRIWDTASWESFSLPAVSNVRISFSQDGKSLAVCRLGAGIELWDLATRMKAADLIEPAARGGNESWALTRFSPQGDRMISAGGLGYVALWDVPAQKNVWVQQVHRSRIYALAFSHDGKRFASGGFDQLIHIWDSTTQEKVMTLQGHLNEIWSLEFSPDDRYLLTSSKDGTVKLWDAEARPPATHWMLDQGEWPIGFTPDGRGLISVSEDGAAVRHWKGPEVIKALPCAAPVERDRTIFAPASQSLYVLTSAGEVQVQDVNTLKVKRSFRISERSPTLYHVSPDERWLTGRGATTRDLYVWDTASGEAVAHIDELQGNVSSRDLAVFSPDSSLLAVATAKWEVKLWDTAKRQFLHVLPPHPWRVYAISFSHDGKYVASSSWAGDVRIFEVATGRESVAPLYGHGSGVQGHCFSPDDATLVSGGDDSTVRFWNVATGREMLVFAKAHNQKARLPFLSPTGELMVWRDFAQNLQARVEAIPTLAELEKARAAENTAR